MTRGLNSYDRKNKRRVRRENHEDYDLRFPKKLKHVVKPSKYNPWSDELFDED